jgi:hypothetical protein
MCSAVEETTLAEVRTAMLSEASRQEVANLKSLLAALCDAVAHVLDDWRYPAMRLCYQPWFSGKQYIRRTVPTSWIS